MAADRDNQKVAHLCDPFNPAIYRLLNWVISKCTEQHKPVTLCGEMAAQPRCFLPLLGMGLRRFSMSPAFVPAIKELACCVTVSHAKDVAQAVLKLQTIAEVRDYLTDQLRNACPNVSQLDMAK
jgi:phosphoenolpyruvate-protein phosphotransferase (PTS system enzyme I)